MPPYGNALAGFATPTGQTERSPLDRLADAVIEVESGGRADAVSPKGAVGLMQVMPETARRPGLGLAAVAASRLSDPAVNRELGTAYLGRLLDRYEGDTRKALAAYNGGMGRVDAAIKKHGENWIDAMPGETQDYVRKVQVANGVADLSEFGRPVLRAASSRVALAPTPKPAAAASGLPDFSAYGELVEDAPAGAGEQPGAFRRGFVSGMFEQNPTLIAETFEGFSHLAPDDLRAGLREASADLHALAKLSPKEHAPRARSLFESRDLDDVLTWTGEAVGQGMASMVPPAITGAAGGAVGGRAGGRIGAIAGTVGGAAASSFALNYGEVYRALKDEKIAPETAAEYAMYAAPFMATLDSIGVTPFITRFGGLPEVKRQVARGIAKRIAAEGGKGFTREGATEMAQEAVKEATVSIAAEKPFFTAETGLAMAEAGIAGGLTGGAVGSATGVMPDRPAAPSPPLDLTPDLEAPAAPAAAPLDLTPAMEEQEQPVDLSEFGEVVEEPKVAPAPEPEPGAAAPVPPLEGEIDVAPHPGAFGEIAAGEPVTLRFPDGEIVEGTAQGTVDLGEDGPALSVLGRDGQPHVVRQGEAEIERGAAPSPEDAAGDGTRAAPVKVESATDVERVAAAAAQSPENDLPEPSQAQKDAGNYQLGHGRDLLGFDFAIETPKGATRKKEDAAGKVLWSVEMPAHYGYLKGTEGADSTEAKREGFDVYVGDALDSEHVFVVDQIDPETGRFDEHKGLIGFPDRKTALQAYDAGFSDGSGRARRGAVTRMTVAEFQKFVREGDTKRALKYVKPIGSTETVAPAGVRAGQAAQAEPAEAGVPAEAAPPPIRETAAQPPAPERRPVARRDVADDTAVTPSGRDVPVTYAVVEAADLVTSNLDDGRVNPAYPADLQPRDRERRVSRGQVDDIARRLNPRLLDRSPKVGDGAPVVAEDGTVESGNARTMAVQRAYAERLPGATAYREHLAAQGYPVEGMKAPILVRVRRGEMSPREREAFTREANERDTLGMSATERAMADAAALPDQMLGLYRGGDIDAAVNRDFVRRFVDQVVSRNERAGMVADDGALSQDAVRRIQGALLAKAYGDADLVASLIESPDTNIKAIGGALTDVAAAWAQLRADAAAGTIDPAMDQTERLLDAVRLVQRARRAGRNVTELVGQRDLLTGGALDPVAEAFLRLLYRNTRLWTVPAGREKIAEALRFYVTEAEKTQPGMDLLGESAVSPPRILALARERQYGQPEPAQADLLEEPARGAGERVREDRRSGGEPELPPPAPAGRRQAAREGAEGAAAEGVEAASTPITLTRAEGHVHSWTPGEDRTSVDQGHSHPVTVAEDGTPEFGPAGMNDHTHAVPRDVAGGAKFALRPTDGTQPPFFSALTRAAEAVRQPRATAEQWKAMLTRAPGVKAEEVAWSGVVEWLDGQKGPVARDDVVAFLRENEVRVEEVTKGGDIRQVLPDDLLRADLRSWGNYQQSIADSTYLYEDRDAFEADTIEQRIEKFKQDFEMEGYDVAASDANQTSVLNENDVTKFAEYTLPGGENYRELLLTLPRPRLEDFGGDRVAYDAAVARAGDAFTGGHFDEPNVLAHVRFNERTDAEGRRILHVEEIQSDWHQRGRKEGYLDNAEAQRIIAQIEQYPVPPRPEWSIDSLEAAGVPEELVYDWDRKARGFRGVPDAPFKTSWHELAFKRVLRHAAENGFDAVTWTTGEQQAERYDLSKQISRIELTDNYSGGIGRPRMEGEFERGMLTAYDHDGRKVIEETSVNDPARLAGLIGKEAAEKLLNATPTEGRSAGIGVRVRSLEGLDLKVGGEGMRGFYDRILPAFANKYGKKWGARVGKVDLSGPQAGYWRSGDPRGAAQARESLKAVHSLPITPAMRESVMQGQPLFHLSEAERKAAASEIAAALTARLGDLGIADRVALDLAPKIEAWIGGERRTADGAYLDRVIRIALDAADPMRTLDHEVIHALRELGVIRPAEWAAVERSVLADEALMRDVARRYQGLGLTRDEMIEEAAADLFARHAADGRAAKGLARRAFERLRALLRAIADVFGERGLTAEDVFGRIESGEVGGRAEGFETGAAETTAAREASEAEAERALMALRPDDAIADPARAPASSDFPLNATGDVVAGDTIRFEEAVFGGSFKRPSLLGNRTIEAEVVRDSYGADRQQHTFTLRVLNSTGTQPLKAGTETRRKARNVYRNGVQRQHWADEDARKRAADEKHGRGELARADRDTRRAQEPRFALRRFSDEGSGLPPATLAKVRGADRQFVKDMGLFKKWVVYPRTIAALSRSFAQVYLTAVRQFHHRDQIIADLSDEALAYFELPNASKQRINAALERGRLYGKTFGTGTAAVVAPDPGSKARILPGETVTLTDAEKSGYWGVRRAMDKALSRFRDQIIKEFGFDPAAVKSAKDIMDLVSADMRDADRARHETAARLVREIEQARRTGYVPFTRWGQVVVTVRRPAAPDALDPLTGNPAEYETVESQTVELSGPTGAVQRLLARGELGRIPAVKRALDAAKKRHGRDPDAEISVFQVGDRGLAGSGLDISAMDMLAEVAKIEPATWEQVRAGLQTAIKAQGFRRHFFGTRNVPGYSLDFERSIADYIQGIGGYLARREYSERWDAAISAIPQTKPREAEYARRYRDYVNNPAEELAALRQAGFLYFIAGNVSTAALNLTQVPVITVPYLTMMERSPVRLAAQFARAYRDATKMMSLKKGTEIFDPAKAPEDVRDAVQAAWDQGRFVPLITYEMMGRAHNRSAMLRGLSAKTRKAIDVAALTYSYAERMNRLATLIAVLRMAKRDPAMLERAREVLADNELARAEILGDLTPETLAQWVVDETHFQLGKVNRPTMMRGVGAAVFQFKSFVLNAIELQYRLATTHGRPGKVAFGLILAALMLTSGMWGLPFAEDLTELFEALYKRWTQLDLDVQTEVREMIAETTGSPILADLLSRGMVRGTGADMSRRIGMGQILPRTAEEAAGVPLSLVWGKTTQTLDYLHRGQLYEAFGEALPNFLKNPIHALTWSEEGIRSQGTGRLAIPPEEIGAGDVALKSLGFTPAWVAARREGEWRAGRTERAADDLRRSVYTRLGRSIAEAARAEERGDLDAAQRWREEIAETYGRINAHNAGAREHEQLILSERTLVQRVEEELAGMGPIRDARGRKIARGRRGEVLDLYDVWKPRRDADEPPEEARARLVRTRDRARALVRQTRPER